MSQLALAYNNQNYKKSSRKNFNVEKHGNVYTISNNKTSGKKKGDKAFPLKTLEEISAVIEYYENKANDKNTRYKQLADRNKLLLILGFNVGIRASDLVKIKWGNVYNSKGEFLLPDEVEIETGRTSIIQEKKTGDTKNLIFNDVVKEAFTEYVSKYDIDILSDDYIFKSRQKDTKGNETLTVEQCSNIVKEAVKACGINRKTASHTLRKTFCWFQMEAHQDDARFTSELMDILNHDNEETTLKYVGLDLERKIKYHNDVQLGKTSKLRKHEKVEIGKNNLVVDKFDLVYILKQLAEKCYTCSNECGTCYNSMIAKKYGYDLNTI